MHSIAGSIKVNEFVRIEWSTSLISAKATLNIVIWRGGEIERQVEVGIEGEVEREEGDIEREEGVEVEVEEGGDGDRDVTGIEDKKDEEQPIELEKEFGHVSQHA